MMRTLAVANHQKGGVGKTNLTGNLGAELAARGHSVVLIDVDPQATLTTWLIGAKDVEGTAAVVLGAREIPDVLIDVSAFGVRLLAAVPTPLRRAEDALRVEGNGEALRGALERVEADFVLIDCPPNLGTMTGNAIVASTGVLIPVSTRAESIDGLIQVKEGLARIGRSRRREYSIAAIVPTRYDARQRIARAPTSRPSARAATAG